MVGRINTDETYSKWLKIAGRVPINDWTLTRGNSVEIRASEKLIIAMLCDVIEALGIKDSIDPAFVRAAVLDGDNWALKWQYPGMLDAEVVKEAPDA